MIHHTETMVMMTKKMIINYIRLEFKRTGIVFWHTLLTLCAMVTIVCTMAVGSVCLLEKSSAYEPVKVAFCTEDKGSAMKSALDLVSSMKSLEHLCSFVYMDENEAVREIRDGRVDCAVVFPENFYKDINTGINTPARVIFQKDSTLGQEIFREIITDAVSMIDTAEAGIYAVTYASDECEMKIAREDMEYLLTKVFALTVLKRDSVFLPFVYGFTASLGLWDYYAVAAVFCIMLMTGLFFGYLYSEGEAVISRKLRINGITPSIVAAVKIFVMGTVLLFIGIIVSSGLCAIGKRFGISMDISFIESLPSCIIVCFSIAALFHFIYSLGKDAHGGRSILFIVEIMLLSLSGTILPVAAFGSKAASLIRFLPGTIWFECLSLSADGSSNYRSLLCAAAYGFVFYILGTVLQWKRS